MENTDEKRIFWKEKGLSSSDHPFLKYDPSKINFAQSLPVHIDFFKRVEALSQFITKKESEVRLCRLTDSPGVGKTTTVHVAATSCGAAYVKTICAKLLCNNIKKKMDEVSKKGPIKANTLQNILQIISFVGLERLFKAAYRLSTEKPTLDLGEINENGLQYPNFMDASDEELEKMKEDSSQRASEACLGLESRLKERNANALLVHIDECQHWSILNKNDFHRKYNDDIVLPDEFVAYHLIAFSSAMWTIGTGFTKFIFSGTNVDFFRDLRFDSALKIFTVNRLEESTPVAVGELLKEFLRMELVAEDTCKKLYEELSGVFRTVQFFLHAVYTDPEPSVDKLEAYQQSAFRDWENQTASSFTALNIPKEIFDHLLLLFSFGENLGATRVSDPEGLCLPRDKMPPEVSKWAQSGIVRMQPDGEEAIIFYYPYPFLRQYFAKKTLRITGENVEALFHQMRARTIDKKTGKGYCFQLAIGLELAHGSQSKLLQHILKQIGDDVVPLATYKGIRFYSSDAEGQAAIDGDFIGVAIDPTTERKLGDLALTALKGGTKIVIRGEMKHSQTQNYLYEGRADFWEKLTASNANVGLFISYYQLDPAQSRNKNHRIRAQNIESDNPHIKFLTIESVELLPTTLDLQFLSFPTSNVTFETLLRGLYVQPSISQMETMQQLHDDSIRVGEIIEKIQQELGLGESVTNKLVAELRMLTSLYINKKR